MQCEQNRRALLDLVARGRDGEDVEAEMRELDVRVQATHARVMALRQARPPQN